MIIPSPALREREDFVSDTERSEVELTKLGEGVRTFNDTLTRLPRLSLRFIKSTYPLPQCRRGFQIDLWPLPDSGLRIFLPPRPTIRSRSSTSARIRCALSSMTR